MESWEFPYCSICYDRLLTNLTLLPNCGHIYHKDCLNSWFDKVKVKNPGCPLCRASVNIKKIVSLNYTISKTESIESQPSNNDDFHSDKIKNELEHLKHRISQASSDNLDLSHKLNSLQTEKDSLQEQLNQELSRSESLSNENKELAFSQERNKTTISGLSNKVNELKEKLGKLENLSKYLHDQNLPEADNLKTFLSQFSNDEKMNILTTRIVELENAVSDLSDKNRKLKIEREETDILYKNMRLEFIKMYTHFNPPPEEEKKPELPGINDDYTGHSTRVIKTDKAEKQSKSKNSEHSSQLTPTSSLNNGSMNPFAPPRTKNIMEARNSDERNLTPGRTIMLSKVKKVKVGSPVFRINERSKAVLSPERTNPFIADASNSPYTSPDPNGLRKPRPKSRPLYESANIHKNINTPFNNNKPPSIFTFFKTKDKNDNSNVI